MVNCGILGCRSLLIVVLQMLILVADNTPHAIETSLFLIVHTVGDFKVTRFSALKDLQQINSCRLLVLIANEWILQGDFTRCGVTGNHSTSARLEFELDAIALLAFVVEEAMGVPVPCHDPHEYTIIKT